MVRTYSEICGVRPEDATQSLQNLKSTLEFSSSEVRSIEDVVDPSFLEQLQFDGYVALGKITPSVQSQINFVYDASNEQSIQDEEPPSVSSILRAKWSVNLRGNTSNTTLGNNPILGIIEQGECVEVVDEPQGFRGQFWTKVLRITCP